MIKNPSELKANALKQISGHWGNVVALILVFIIIFSAIIVPNGVLLYISDMILTRFGLGSWLLFIVFIIDAFLVILMTYGLQVAFFDFYKSNKDNLIGKLFVPFGSFNRYLGTGLLVGLYTFLWTLLFIIPGIIKKYSYALVPYILRDTDLSYNEAITLSRKMMDGRKGKLFWLDLTFIGWYILASFTAGIGFLWLIPYHQITRVAFYNDLKEQTKSK